MKQKYKYIILVILLLFFSGNPLISFLFGKYYGIVGLSLTFLVVRHKLKIEKKYVNQYKYMAAIILTILILQFFFLPLISELAVINLLLKLMMGGLIIYYLKESFAYYFFIVLSTFSLISLIFFLFINVGNFNLLPYILIRPGVTSYIIYGTSYAIHFNKNAGMFWEPGAHAGVLTLCLALNFKNLKYFWNVHKFKLIMLLVALITTQSTAGYIVGFAIGFFYFIQQKNYLFSVIIISIFLSAVIYVYQKKDFLKNKIETQYQNATQQNIGEFSNSRFGSIIFDWHYIQKHPLIGNSFNLKTRYQDHQYMFIGEKEDVISSGNGFSNYLASMGVFFIFSYFYFLIKSVSVNGKWFSVFLVLVVFLNLQSEQWFNFPLYLGLPFLCYLNTYKSEV